MFASFTVSGAGVTGSHQPRPTTRPATSAAVTPAIRFQHLNRSSLFAAFGEVSASGSSQGPKRGLGYLTAIDWRQDLSDQLQFRASAIKGRRTAASHLFGMAGRTDMAIDELFGPCPISGERCDFSGGALHAAARQGDFLFEARATALAMRWSGEDLDSTRTGAVFVNTGGRATWQRSHRFAPFMEGAAQWRGIDGNRQGVRRLVGGIQAPAVRLFSGGVFAGVETPTRGPLLPALGGELVWSPRRNLKLGVRGETGSAAKSSPETLFSSLHNAGRHDQAKRRLQGVLFLHWSPGFAWGVDLGASWVSERWLERPATLAASAETLVIKAARGLRRERARSANGRLTWTFSDGWAAQLDVAATYTSGTGRPSRRDVVVAVGLRKDFGR